MILIFTDNVIAWQFRILVEFRDPAPRRLRLEIINTVVFSVIIIILTSEQPAIIKCRKWWWQACYRIWDSDLVNLTQTKKCSKGVISTENKKSPAEQPNIMGCGLKPISHVWWTKIVKYDEDKGDYQPHDFVCYIMWNKPCKELQTLNLLKSKITRVEWCYWVLSTLCPSVTCISLNKRLNEFLILLY